MLDSTRLILSTSLDQGFFQLFGYCDGRANVRGQPGMVCGVFYERDDPAVERDISWFSLKTPYERVRHNLSLIPEHLLLSAEARQPVESKIWQRLLKENQESVRKCAMDWDTRALEAVEIAKQVYIGAVIKAIIIIILYFPLYF
eukprot:g83475.t1